VSGDGVRPESNKAAKRPGFPCQVPAAQGCGSTRTSQLPITRGLPEPDLGPDTSGREWELLSFGTGSAPVSVERYESASSTLNTAVPFPPDRCRNRKVAESAVWQGSPFASTQQNRQRCLSAPQQNVVLHFFTSRFTLHPLVPDWPEMGGT